MEPISSADARTNFSDMIAQAFYQNKGFIVYKSKRAMAVILSFDEYQKLQPSQSVKAKRQKGGK